MNHAHYLFTRGDASSTFGNSTMFNLLIALLVLVIASICLIGGLLILRNLRKSRKQTELPLYNEKPTSPRTSNHQRLTITATPYTASNRSESIYVVQEKQNLIANSSSPPASPIPEIRITFPEEIDASGKRQSGRVVVVRVGEHNVVGLEPLHEDLPSYQHSDSGRFHSLDLERIGGLKEKKDWA